ncbi:transaminase [Aquipuribacter hungaricus]|uniref:Transaminase n=2 Tax=Aquipuribacter hungaricus TaxID=545624 RepID=A0ABV7WHI7_9MICO
MTATAPAGTAGLAGGVDPARIAALHEAAVRTFEAQRPRSRELHERARASMPGGVPMSWMVKWPGPWPTFVDRAQGAHFTCVDGIDHVDLCLGDTGAMTGHSPAATVRAVTEQLGRGITTMLPGEDAAVAAEDLASRFGLPQWQFTLTATDANRHLLRYARHVTGRPKVAVVDWCYHGSVDESFATLDADGRVVARRGNIGPPVPLAETTAVLPFNDVEALEAALGTGEVACVLLEPAMTNIGIVLPDDGYLAAVRDACDRTGTLMVVDETHTLCAGPGGCTRAWDLRPDAVVVGKTIGGGVPAAAFGMTADLTARVQRSVELEDIDVGGVGGTLAGNALSMAAVRATLTEVLTPAAFETMTAQAVRWTEGVQAGIDAAGLPWQVTRLGCRAEYTFRPEAPHDGAQAAAADDFALQQLVHLQALVDGILLTPFHNMALMSPVTTAEDVDRHTASFGALTQALVG